MVEQGASLQEKDKDGNGLLHLAARHNQEAIALWLIQQGCSEKKVNNEQKRPRDIAKDHQHKVLAKTLIHQHQRQKLAKHLPFFIAPYQQQMALMQQELATVKEQLSTMVTPCAVTQELTDGQEEKGLSLAYSLK